jgi:hypothetical protein
MRELSRDESLRLLSSVAIGRVVFTLHALPAVRPVNHLVDGGHVVIRTEHGSALAPGARGGVVVAYEADDIDPVEHVGWSVIVTGRTELVDGAGDVARYRDLLRPWVSDPKELIVRIRSEIVTGFALTES